MTADSLVNGTEDLPGKKSIETLKVEAARLVFGLGFDASSESNDASANNGQETIDVADEKPLAANGHYANGHASHPAGYSQTGEFLGVAPESVNADVSNASLPPPELAKSIPCKFFPNCKYGESCAFQHGISSPTHPANGQTHQTHRAFGYASMGRGLDSQISQGGMPVPPEYAAYMYGAHMAGTSPYYHPMMFGPYHNSPYPPANVNYGYQQYGYPRPVHMSPPSHSPASPRADRQTPSPAAQSEAQTPTAGSLSNGKVSPLPNAHDPASSDSMTQQAPEKDHASDLYSTSPVANTTTVFNMPPNHSIPPFHHQQPGPDSFMPMNGHFQQGRQHTNSHRRANSLSSSTNRRMSFHNSSASQTHVYPPASHHSRSHTSHNPPFSHDLREKRSNVPCQFFATKECLNGDFCHFSHYLADGTDAKTLSQNIVAISGAKGDSQEIEAFIKTKEIKSARRRDTAFDLRGRPNFHQRSDMPRQAQSLQRVPNHADFPTLQGKSSMHVNGDFGKSTNNDHSNRIDTSVSTESENRSAPAAPSFAAAARAAPSKQPTARKLAPSLERASEPSTDTTISSADSVLPTLPTAIAT